MEQLAQLIENLVRDYGYWTIGIAMFLDSANIPTASEIILPFGGYLAHAKVLNLWFLIILTTIVSTLGSIFNYYLGYFGGKPLFDRFGKYFLLSANDYNKGQDWFNKHGNLAAFFGRFIPGVRTFISFPAGIAKVNLTKFTIYTAAGSFIWCGLLTYGGFLLGDHWKEMEKYFENLHIVVIVLAIVFVTLYIWHKIKEFKKK